MPDVLAIVMMFAVVCKEMQQMEHIISERGSVWRLSPRFYKIGGCILHNLFFIRRRSYNVF